MKKKAAVKKKSKKAESQRPPKVGGRSRIETGVNWSRVGRRRLNNDDAVQDIAKAMKALREAKGQSIGKLAKELNVAPATIIKFEDRGHPVSIKIVTAMAERLGSTLELKTVSTRKKK
ncbi:MAG TPA: helix-turn-helix domain-containing protein [Planctomycetes bacterium]|nr:helix-turn-helix domain-containing protein [Fuerstiella sp.]HIK94792.1 helix-turn-helix domain-containing protein [Planctomycetota bacterium]